MHSKGSPWTVTITSDPILNFAVYVGCCYAIFDGAKDAEQRYWPYGSLLKPETDGRTVKPLWDEWWSRLVQQKADFHTRGCKTFLPSKDFPEPDHSLLKDCCDRAWPAFRSWWHMPAGGQYALYYWENQPQVGRYIRAYEESTGRELGSFSLTIDLVYSGLKEPVKPLHDYIIMPADPNILLKKEWWMKQLDDARGKRE